MAKKIERPSLVWYRYGARPKEKAERLTQLSGLGLMTDMTDRVAHLIALCDELAGWRDHFDNFYMGCGIGSRELIEEGMVRRVMQALEVEMTEAEVAEVQHSRAYRHLQFTDKDWTNYARFKRRAARNRLKEREAA
jgi:hypothetical protein